MVDRLAIEFRENLAGLTTIAPEPPPVKGVFHMASAPATAPSREQVLNPQEPILVESLQTVPAQPSPEDMIERQRLSDTVMYGGQELPPAETVQGMQMPESDLMSLGKGLWNTTSEAMSALFGALEDKGPEVDEPEPMQMNGPHPVAPAPAMSFQMKAPFGL